MGRCQGGRCQKKSDIDPQFRICSFDFFFFQYPFKWLETDFMSIPRLCSKIQEEESDTNQTGIPVVQNLQEFLKSPFHSLDDPIDDIML
jgi:hypothetical protein